MKFLKVVSLTLLLSSCAHKSQNIDEINEYSFKHHKEIVSYVCEKIDAHKDYNEEQKKKLKKLLTESMNKNRDLKIRESKTAQLFLDSLIVENYNETRVSSIKEDMHKVYDEKEKLFISTASKIKEIVGVKSKNHSLTEEIVPFMR